MEKPKPLRKLKRLKPINQVRVMRFHHLKKDNLYNMPLKKNQQQQNKPQSQVIPQLIKKLNKIIQRQVRLESSQQRRTQRYDVAFLF